MVVVCLGCRAEVSEWAARCPHCRRGLDDAELLPEPALPTVEVATAAVRPDAPAEVSLEKAEAPTEEAAGLPPRRLAMWKKMRVGAAVSAATVALAGALVVAGVGTSAAHARRGRLPDDLTSERLFLAEGARTGLYRADGTRLRNFPEATGTGYIQPLLSGAGMLVYIHSGSVYRISGSSMAEPVNLGLGSLTDETAATIFPAGEGRIGIEMAAAGGPPTFRRLTPDGEAVTPAYPAVPSGATVVAAVPSGLLVETHGSFSDPILGISSLRLTIIQPHASVFLGLTSAVIGVHDALVAWTTCPAPRSPDCTLQVRDTSSGAVHAITPPASYSGWAPSGGAFSPNGRMLAAFVPSQLRGGATVLHPAVEDVATGAVSLAGPAVPADALLGATATWSADGRWLYFGGVSGHLHAQEVGRTGPIGPSWTLPLSISETVIGD